MRHMLVRFLAASVWSWFFGQGSLLAQHAGDIFVGRNASGQLAVGGFDGGENLIVLPPVSALFVGWADNEPWI